MNALMIKGSAGWPVCLVCGEVLDMDRMDPPEPYKVGGYWEIRYLMKPKCQCPPGPEPVYMVLEDPFARR